MICALLRSTNLPTTDARIATDDREQLAQYDTLAGMNSDEDKKLKTSLDFVLSVGMHSRITSKPLRTQCAKSFFQSVGSISVKPLAAQSGYPVFGVR